MSKKVILSLVILLIVIAVVIVLLHDKSKSTNSLNTEGGVTISKNTTKINITIGNYEFPATLENNETTRELIQMFPMTVNMDDHLSNEKFYALSTSLPTNSYNPSEIRAGDFMLFGSKTIVIFYDNFNTSYSYTKLGRIDDTTNLEAALTRGRVTVSFERVS